MEGGWLLRNNKTSSNRNRFSLHPHYYLRKWGRRSGGEGGLLERGRFLLERGRFLLERGRFLLDWGRLFEQNTVFSFLNFCRLPFLNVCYYLIFLFQSGQKSHGHIESRCGHKTSRYAFVQSERSNEGLTLETSALSISLLRPIHIINPVGKIKLSCYTPPPTKYHNFLRNLPPLFRYFPKPVLHKDWKF